MRWLVLAWIVVGVIAAAEDKTIAAESKTIVGCRDASGQEFQLDALAEDPLVVVAFLGLECPLARLYSHRLNELREEFGPRGVAFVAVSANRHDTFEAMREFAKGLNFPMLHDEAGRVVEEFAATRSPEVFLLDQQRQVIYQGRIDDQYAPGVHGRTAPMRRDLAEAIHQALARQPIDVATTEPPGCHIDRGPAIALDKGITYSRDIAAIMDARCVECHRPGEAAPFSLVEYEDVVNWRETIREVVAAKRMPPWGARGGHFANDRSLSDEQRRMILAWIDGGAPEGDPTERPRMPRFKDGWQIRADRVLAMPTAFEVPREGVLDYQEFVIDPGFTSDTWVQAVEIRPGNRAVVHHINVYVKPKGADKDRLYVDSLGDYYLAMAVPGNSVTQLPPGTAKLIPAGWTIVMSVHYTPNGVAQPDISRVALELADPRRVRKQIATRAILDDYLVIEPEALKTVTHRWTVEDDYTLYALYPHMHWRGKSMRFDACYPNGETEVLLDVPAYDFAWQFRYVLSTPRALPRGTAITVTAVYDNTTANPNNPDPQATVRSGRQSTDEMFQACFEICRTHEDLVAARHSREWTIAYVGLVLAATAYVWHRLSVGRQKTGRFRPELAEPVGMARFP
jgi:peroxiredoxin